MEKFRGALIVFLLVSVQALFAQEPLCVLKVDNGIVYSKGKWNKILFKGALIKTEEIVSLSDGATMSFIDHNGVLYKLDKPGEYKYTQLKTYKVQKDQSSLTEKYLKYLWEEMTQTSGSGTVIGGVFRGESLMLSPRDSALVVDSKIRFTWKTDSLNAYYFFLRNKQTQELLKLSTNGSELTLFKENPIFYEGNDFEWYIDTEAFPNLDNKTFNAFTTIDRTAYETKKETYSEFIKDLLDSGLTDVEINQILCETYGLCK